MTCICPHTDCMLQNVSEAAAEIYSSFCIAKDLPISCRMCTKGQQGMITSSARQRLVLPMMPSLHTSQHDDQCAMQMHRLQGFISALHFLSSCLRSTSVGASLFNTHTVWIIVQQISQLVSGIYTLAFQCSSLESCKMMKWVPASMCVMSHATTCSNLLSSWK